MKHGEWVPIEKRPLSPQELSWVKDILAASQDWSDVTIGPLYAIAKCGCGLCKTVLLETPPEPHNPTSKLRAIGEIDIQTEKNDLITIMLHSKDGFLTELEIICDHSFKTVPQAWTEVARWVHVYNGD